jgi:CHAT domain-containing protein/Tfp pilus assembly protein PilF
MRASLPLIAIIIVSSVSPLTPTCAQQASTNANVAVSPAGSQANASYKDAPAPVPTSAVKTLLASIETQLKNKQYAAALANADIALKTAQERKDHTGVALARTLRATALEGLHRNNEAIASWRSAADAWHQIPYGPRQVEALASAGILLMNSHPDEAKQLVAQAIALARSETKSPLQAARALNNGAISAYDLGQDPSSQALAEAALPLVERLDPDSLDVALSLVFLGNVANDNSQNAVAERYYKRALRIREKLLPGSREVANCWNSLGNVAYDRNDLAVAEDDYRHALEIRQKLAPDSLDVAGSWLNLGNLALKRNEFSTAESYYRHTLEIEEKQETESPNAAIALNDLGIIRLYHGDLSAAESYFKHALESQQKRTPGSLDVVKTLNNLGIVATQGGDLVSAENYYQSALQIEEKQAPESPDVATVLGNLGTVARGRRDLPAAERYYQHALKIENKKIPGTLQMAQSLSNLGLIALDRRDLLAAERYYQHALEIQVKQAPGTVDIAPNLNNLGIIAMYTDDLATAEQYYKRALEIWQKEAPESIYVATSLNNQGEVAYRRGDLTTAENNYKRALDIWKAQAPGSLDTASALNNLGMVFVKQDHLEQARDTFAQAVDIVEAQRGNIAGADARSLLVEANTDAYAALLDVYIALHQDDNAFKALERARGRSLSESLYEHQHLDLSGQVPQNLLAQQRRIDNDRNIVLTERQQLDANKPEDKPRFANNDAALQQLDTEQRQLEARIRSASPHYAGLQYPTPLSLEAVQNALDPGTLLLEYAIEEQQVYLFTVTRRTFQRYTLPFPRQNLLAKINALTKNITAEGTARNNALAVELYDRLVKPAQSEIRSAQRLLFCPEKEMWRIPFCALIDNDNPQAPRYLVESKPIHCIVSMNVYDQIIQNRNRRRTATLPLLAFGDPAYGLPPKAAPTSSLTAKAATHSRLLLGGHSFERWAITGAQVRAIQALYGQGARVHLDREATRSKVFQEAGQARILHFACHGWLDHPDPLASFLALAPERSGEQFGRLAAYDVLERLHLDADLVTLGACETGGGEETGTEGVIGLTRSFIYAGAQSVLVSLWPIDANSSSLLLSGTDPLSPGKGGSRSTMAQCFYGALKAGKSKDEALRTAQIALIHGKRKDYQDPQNWAAFSLQGDWR